MGIVLLSNSACCIDQWRYKEWLGRDLIVVLAMTSLTIYYNVITNPYDVITKSYNVITNSYDVITNPYDVITYPS